MGLENNCREFLTEVLTWTGASGIMIKPLDMNIDSVAFAQAKVFDKVIIVSLFSSGLKSKYLDISSLIVNK